MKRLWVALTILGSIGLLAVIVLTFIEGVKYRIREEQGLDPISAPSWVGWTTYVGLGVFAFALVALAATGIVALVRRRRRNTHRPSSPRGPSTT